MTRLFWPLTIVLLGFLVAVQVLSMRDESPTWDEPIELAAGYSYLKTGDFRLNPEHPPLAKMIQALPLLALQPVLPTDSVNWREGDETEFGREFLFRNRIPSGSILFAARLASVFLTLCLGMAITLWTRSSFGPGAALLALTLFALDPTVIAHGRYVKNDIALALFAFLACVAWGSYLNRPTRWRLLLSGIAAGCACAVKYSAVFLAPVFVVLYAIRAWQRKSEALPGAIRSLAGAGAAGALVILLVYAPATRLLRPATQSMRARNPEIRMLYSSIPNEVPAAAALISVSRRLGIQSHPLLQGVVDILYRNYHSNINYLLGKFSPTGWWYYFPVAFAVKTPVATLVAIALAAWLGLHWRPWRRLRSISFTWFVMAVPLGVYATASLASHINIGIRHLLPAYPFLFVLTAALLTRTSWRWKSAVLLLLVAGLGAESISIYPYYLSFFNVLAGGPSNGHAILLDSNLDWGQDARRLKTWMDAHHTSEVCAAFFGSEDLGRIGIHDLLMPRTPDIEQRNSIDCWGAVSVTLLEGLYVGTDAFAWLRGRKPVDRIGYSIYIYDLRSPATR